MKFDHVIVGAGTAGCVVAARLSEDAARSVLLLEAGPDYGPWSEAPAELRDAFRMPRDPWDWGLEATVVDERRGWLGVGKVVGGTSATNGAGAWRPPASDFDAWAERSGCDWGWASVVEHFRRIETDADFGDRPWHGASGPVPIARWRDEDLLPVMRSWLEASLDSGQPFSEDMNSPDAVGIGFNPQNRVDATRVSASAAYLDGARSRPNLTVRAGATAERVVLEGDRAAGVVVDGETVEAAEVILCAGVPYSPALLQRSGIGPVEVLRAAGIEPRAELPGVGERVMDQPVVVLMGVPAEDGAAPGQPFLQLAARLAAFPGFPEEHRFYLCLFAGMEADPPVAALLRTDRVHWVIAGDLAPASTGFVAVRSADAAEQPEVSLGFYGVEGDLERMRSGVRAAWELAQHPSFRPHVQRFGLVSQRVVDDDEKLDGMLRRATFSRQTFGGCAMGDVVDAACRVHGVAGLRVADASIVPVPLRAGGALTALVIGERVADAIRSGS